MSRTTTHPGGGQTLAARWLVKNGMSREEVAEALDVHPTRISRWLSGAEKCHEGALYGTVLWLLGEDADELDKIETDQLTEKQRERVIVALRAVSLCNAAWDENNKAGATETSGRERAASGSSHPAPPPGRPLKLGD